MRIRVGNQTAFSAPSTELPFEFALAHGFDAFEWFPDRHASGIGWTEDDLTQEQRAFIKSRASAHDLTLSVHAPWWANPLNPGAHELLFKSVAFAEDIGASLFNIHLYHDEGIAAYVRAIRPVLDRLASLTIKLSIENTPLTDPGAFNDLLGELDRLGLAGSESVGMCLDVGHANLCRTTRNDYLKFIDLLPAQMPIIHVHLHENYGDHDSHLVLFTGPAGRDATGIEGLLERLNRRSFSGCFILEQWPEPPDLLLEARNKLLEMIGKVSSPVGATPETREIPPDPPLRKGGESYLHQVNGSPSLPNGGGGCLHQANGSPPLRKGGKGGFSSPSDAPKAYEQSARDFVQILAEADRKNLSWREKLGWVQEVLSDKETQPDQEKLVYLAIYLRFIGTGQIPCREDGHHYRPSHHAAMARTICDRLAAITNPKNVFIVRKIYPWLPSSGDEFTRSEPLTLIRDIAHRNDIPRELKQEIKRTLQNKLHRCAGPEDLDTSGALLARITTQGAGFSPAFVMQFKLFHEQLKEFFSAGSLEEQLQALARNGHAPNATLIRAFLERKGSAVDLPQQLEVLHLLSNLREQLDASLLESIGPVRQQLQLADIKLEAVAFVLLSRLITHFEREGTATLCSSGLECLCMTVSNLRGSGFDAEECRAIEAELNAWRQHFDRHDRRQVLRLQATLKRAKRLAEYYRDTILELFPERVEKLGRTLEVPDLAIRFYAESEIRSHLVFQLSKILALLLMAIREDTVSSPWEVIVPGTVTGFLEATPSLQDLPPASQPVVALVDRLDGDEELQDRVSGVIITHETPYLSHFAVRARQTGVVFVACLEAEGFSDLKRFLARRIVLDAGADRVDVRPLHDAGCQTGNSREQGKEVRALKIPEVAPFWEPCALSLDRVTAANSGRKADGARRLEELSRSGGASFKIPAGLVIPFGVMEASLHSQPSLEREYHLLVGRLGKLPPEELPETLKRIRLLLSELEVPNLIVSEVIRRFGPDARLMVRSSASCEDLEEFATAGLYESVANVPPRRVASAVRKVWASLWTIRAVLSRQNAGIPHNQAFMAVLIQQLVPPDLSFIMHTRNPTSKDPDEMLVELVAGLGETLASPSRPGNPYRMVCNKRSGEARLLAFANFSRGVFPGTEEGVFVRTLDYCKIALSFNKSCQERIGSCLTVVGGFVEASLRSPQDIEGVITGSTVYLVQSRPQQGIFMKTYRIQGPTCLRQRSASAIPPPKPEMRNLFALFQKRLEGDDALLRLARLRFREVGLGAEFYAESPAELDWLMGFRPTAGSPAVVHLSRDVNILDEVSRNLILDFAATFQGRLLGLVIHDQPEMATQPANYVAALRDLGTRLEKVLQSPTLFLEYASGLDLELFLETLHVLRGWERVSGCIDVGHIGLWQVRTLYSRLHPGVDVCKLIPQDPELPELIEDVQSAVRSALTAVLEVIRALTPGGKPLHFHLHDGHPLSNASPFEVSDHLSFLEHIPIPFEWRGKYSLDLMFGASGLVTIVTQALHMLGAAKVSFSLEIHPTEGQLALGGSLPLFSHWVDKTNAERMNYWLSVLQQHCQLLLTAFEVNWRQSETIL